ncbi:cytochrome C oxidase subunit IV family protein [Candidatus Palauibacter sp.]|uniref:cytochrome C oxidase subunit IV family protein n=1 Tax=Candidatus Palauibacter sp. TaxID=3101350 RepID=UPI003B5C385D
MNSHSAGSHPSTRLYIAIAVILAALTALEVMVFYIEALAPVLIPILLVMMAAKFALVAMFFMHLKSDGPLLTGVFAWGLFIATAIVVGLLAIFGKLGG